MYTSRIPIKRLRKSRRLNKRRSINQLRENIVSGVRISMVFFLGFIVLVFLEFLNYLQTIAVDLPTPEKPFGKKSIASEIYDRNGKLLYRVFDDEDRDPVNLEEIPPLVEWAFLAAEDANFYNHQGVDLGAIVRCGIRIIESNSNVCGGSTITQQLIKKTALTDEISIERKLKEIILALKIEQERSKEEILEMYLTIVPEGSNIYGITRAAKFYFGKEISELSLAEISVLAAIPQNPSRLSPTKSLTPTSSRALLENRRNYVLDQMLKHIDQINESAKENETDEDILTIEMITEARDAEIAYRDPIFPINSPHFVFYVQELLQQRPYNQGQPFDLAEIETAGLRIYTTLDLDFQRVAEEEVRRAVDVYGKRYGAENASMLALNPNNGEVLAYVGSYNYFGKPSPEGCISGRNCKFEPQVNIPNTLQAYGSTLKPYIYYNAFIRGMIDADSLMSDVPIQINNYRPKNYEGKFYGQKSARWMLINSRNIPAILLTQQMGPANLLREIKNWGYTTFPDPNAYGPAIAVGGGDIKLIEHAQGYAVLASGGMFNQVEVISRIEDSSGRIIYEHKANPTRVADERAVYLVNDILNGREGGVGYSFDGRDIAGKTGTSERQTETLFIAYTPEIVALGWLGNNSNVGMRYGATGFTSVRPWVSSFVERLGDKIPPTPFSMPSGVYYSSGHLAIKGIDAPASIGVPSQYRVSEILGVID